MKHCKQYLFFLLAGALLVLPVTSHYAYTISWNEIREKVTKFFSEDRLQKIIPGAIMALGLAGSLYYWWTRKGGGASVPKSLESSEEESSEELVAPSLKQFTVYSQFDSDGGGAASCGYQTLLRGMQVVRAKSEGESDASIEKTLMDSSPIQVYFGPKGGWRKKIIARRKNQELKKALHLKFLLALNQNCDAKEKDLYKSALGFLEDIVVIISRSPQQRINLYDFTDQAICEYLAKSLNQLKNETNEALIEKLQLPEVISQCFDLEQMRKEFLSKDFLLSLPQLIQELNDDPDLREDFAGEWLSDGEVEYLWNQDKNDIVPLNVNCGFKAIANFELVGNPDVPQEVDEVSIYIKENIKPFLNTKWQAFAIFALGTMRQTGSTSGTRGHWYPLVMYQNKEGKRQYYIMDSAHNSDRTKDENAWKIINLIEQ